MDDGRAHHAIRVGLDRSVAVVSEDEALERFGQEMHDALEEYDDDR